MATSSRQVHTVRDHAARRRHTRGQPLNSARAREVLPRGGSRSTRLPWLTPDVLPEDQERTRLPNMRARPASHTQRKLAALPHASVPARVGEDAGAAAGAARGYRYQRARLALLASALHRART